MFLGVQCSMTVLKTVKLRRERWTVGNVHALHDDNGPKMSWNVSKLKDQVLLKASYFLSKILINSKLVALAFFKIAFMERVH